MTKTKPFGILLDMSAGIDRKILEFMAHPNYAKGKSVDSFGEPLLEAYTKKAIADSFRRLRQKGFIDVDRGNGSFGLTEAGKEYICERGEILEMFDFEFPENAPKDLLVSYDISNYERRKRDWLRYHLKRFDYILVQRSLWVGPSPLPKDFRDYLKEIGLASQMKMFKLSKPYKDSTGGVK